MYLKQPLMSININKDIKVLWVETYDGQQFDIKWYEDNNLYKNCFSGVDSFSLDGFIFYHSKTDLHNVKRIGVYERFIYAFNINEIDLRIIFFGNARIRIEEVRLPEGIERFSCTNRPNTTINELHIPRSLIWLRCYNDMRIIGLGEKMDHENLKEIDIRERERQG